MLKLRSIALRNSVCKLLLMLCCTGMLQFAIDLEWASTCTSDLCDYHGGDFANCTQPDTNH